MKVFVVLAACLAVAFTADDDKKEEERPKIFKKLLPADVLRDFPGVCFGSTNSATIEPGKTWDLTPFCGRSTCVSSEDKPPRLLELVEDCGPLPLANAKCKLDKEKNNKTAPFPGCCPHFKCEEGEKLEYPEVPTTVAPTIVAPTTVAPVPVVFTDDDDKKEEGRPKIFKRLLPADVLRDFPGMCFGSTKSVTIEPGKTWDLTPFCGRSTCVLSEDKPPRLLELVEDCGPLPLANAKCELDKAKTNKTAPFPGCCPHFKCEEEAKLEYPEVPTTVAPVPVGSFSDLLLPRDP